MPDKYGPPALAGNRPLPGYKVKVAICRKWKTVSYSDPAKSSMILRVGGSADRHNEGARRERGADS